MKSIGVVGCGLMGSRIASNLLNNNYKVFVFDINVDSVKGLVNKGANTTKSVRELARNVDVMILSLPSPALIKKLMIDEHEGEGAFHVMQKGACIIDMSTNDVTITRELSEQAKTYGLDFLDCPLSGGPAGAETGTLTIMVGGNERAFTSMLPVLEVIGEQIDYVGPSGSGQIVKLCNNIVVGGVITLLSEALLTGEKAGVSKEKLAGILQKGSAQTKVMDVFGPNILHDTFHDVKFSLENMLKDINLYRNLAEANQVPTFASQNAQQLFQIAKNNGKSAFDSTAVHEIIAGFANSQVNQK